MLFEIFDANSDGFISNTDLFKTLKCLYGENNNTMSRMTDIMLQQMVNKTILYDII